MKGWGYWIFNTIELYVRFQSCTMFSNSCLSAKCSTVLSFPRLYPFQMKTPEWRSADKGFSSWSVLSTLPMASLSSALFFNFGSYSPYMDISSYLSLSPTFPTFSHQSVCCKVFPVFPPRFSPTHFSWLFLSIFVARFSHQLRFFPNNPHLAILQRLLWSAGVRMGARREDKKILPIGEEDHLQCTHTPV